MRRLIAPALAASTIASLAAIPAGSALAATPVVGTVPALTSLSLPNGVLTPAETQRVVEELLGKLPAGEVTALESKLGVGPLPTNELAGDVTNLLKNGSPAAVEPVIQELFGTLGFQSSTLGALAEKLGLPVSTLAGELGTSANPATQVLSVPLGGGTFRTVVDGPEGVKVTTLETKESNNGGAGTTTVIPGPSSSPTPANKPPASKTVVKVKILSHKVKGHVATLVIQVPVAGKVVVGGGGVKAVTKKAAKSERLTVKLRLSKAGTASLHKRHKHHNALKVALKASFKPTAGPSSSASVTVRFA